MIVPNETPLTAVLFPGSEDLKRRGKCPLCREDVNQELLSTSELRKEFKITGVCVSCQARIRFKRPDNDKYVLLCRIVLI